MKRTYQIAWAKTSEGRKRLVRFLAKEGQLWLLPLLELIQTGECVVDELIDVVGRAAIEAILVMSRADSRAAAAGQAEGPGGRVLVRQPARTDRLEGASVAGSQAATAEERASSG
jgi:hypothetical protein